MVLYFAIERDVDDWDDTNDFDRCTFEIVNALEESAIVARIKRMDLMVNALIICANSL